MTTARKGQASAPARKPRRSTATPTPDLVKPAEPVSDDLTDFTSPAMGDLIFGGRNPRSVKGKGAKAGQTVNLDDHREVKGLAEHEVIDQTYPFDGDIYHRVCWSDPAGEKDDTYRMVHRQRKQDPETGAVVITLVAVLDGALSCPERAVHVAIDARTRTLKSEVTEESFLFRYQENSKNPPRTTVVTDTELLETARKKNWMTRLGLSTIIRPTAAKHSAVLSLMRAVAFNAREDGQATVRIIDQTGPVYIDGQLCYANAAGYIGPDGDRVNGMGYVFGPTGVVTSVRCRPSKETNHVRDIEYPVEVPKTKTARVDALDALASLLTAYHDLGLTGIQVGQLIGSTVAGVTLQNGDATASVTINVGDSLAGKTAFQMLLFMSQTRSLYGATKAAISARVADKGSSNGARPAGMYTHLSPFSGCLILLDDLMKKDWPEARQNHARDTIMESVVTGIMSGGALQAQGNNGKVDAAPSKNVYHSAVFTSECIGPVAQLKEDSTYNRVAVVWWDKDKRCSKDTYLTLRSKANTLLRNDGLRVTLGILLSNPETFMDGYTIGYDAMLAAGLEERVAENYARCLAGLHILDLAYRENGRKTTHYLADAIGPAIEIARRMESHGTNGGDQMARADIVEATREALTILLDLDKSVFIAEVPEKAPAGTVLVPTEPEHLPYGFGPGDCGWYPDTDMWKHKSTATQIGVLIENLGGNRRPHPFHYRVQMSGSEWAALHDKLNYVSGLRGYRQCSRDERSASLIEAGILLIKNHRGSNIYQLDYLWVRSTTYADVVAAEAAANDEGDD